MQNQIQKTSVASSPKLLDRVRGRLRVLHYSIRTETAYVDWITRYLKFHRSPNGLWRHPAEMGAPEIEKFLTHLAVEGRVSASTQTQALSGILFLYKQVLELDPGNIDSLRAK